MLFVELDKLTLKFILNFNRAQITKNNIEKNNKTRELTCPNFNTYDKAVVIKSVSQG